MRQRILQRNDPFSPPGLEYVSEIEDSRRLQSGSEPCIIIAGAGMCEGGRILHHFATALGCEKNSVVVVGFMAQHTLGRRLIEGRPRVKVFGVERDVHARIHRLEGLSAHADQDDLVAFVEATARAGRLERVVLVHGEAPAQRSLVKRLEDRRGPAVIVARKGERLEL